MTKTLIPPPTARRLDQDEIEMGSKPIRAAFYTIADVATQLGLSTKTIRRWIARKELRVHHLGRQLRISAEDLAAFLGQRRR